MIEMNTGHSDFSVEMEILASIPCHSESIALADLLVDFGWKTQDKLTPYLDSLNRRFGVKRCNRRGVGRCAFIPREHWRAATEAADDYWNAVYGRKMASSFVRARRELCAPAGGGGGA